MFLAKPLRFRADLVCARSYAGRAPFFGAALFLCPADPVRQVDLRIPACNPAAGLWTPLPAILFLRLSPKSVSRKRSMFAWPAGSFRVSHLCYGRFVEGAQAGLREEAVGYMQYESYGKAIGPPARRCRSVGKTLRICVPRVLADGKILAKCVPGRQSVANFALHASRKRPRTGKSPVRGSILPPCIQNELAMARYARHVSEMPCKSPFGNTPREDLATKGIFSLHRPLESCTARRSCHPLTLDLSATRRLR